MLSIPACDCGYPNQSCGIIPRDNSKVRIMRRMRLTSMLFIALLNQYKKSKMVRETKYYRPKPRKCLTCMKETRVFSIPAYGCGYPNVKLEIYLAAPLEGG